MITNNIFWIIFVAGLGVPSAIVGFCMSRLSKKIEASEKAKAEKDETRIEYEAMMIELIMASLSLSGATAKAVKNIPEAQSRLGRAG